MEQNRDYFKKQEEYVANNYMSANGESPIVTSPGSYGGGYKLFTSQYFIGIGVGMLLGYFLLPKILKK
tara:strand:- start:592 stop:795 length:204 start_codon:yes stop_codon:yes gene_type:complete